MVEPTVTPEALPLSYLLVHPILSDTKFLAAVVGVILLVIAYIVSRPSAIRIGRRSGPATVLLVGPSDGGKTALFAQLSQSSYPQTHTSVQTSTTIFSLSNPDEESSTTKSIRLIDVPGHPRLRDEIKKHTSEASAVVFVIDTVGILRNGGQIVEQIPPLLTTLASTALRHPTLPPPKVLFLAHKADLLIRPAPPVSPSPPNLPEQTKKTAVDRLKSVVTREMDRLKSTRGSAGGKIENLGRVAGTSSGNFFTRLFGRKPVIEDSADIEEDETLIWGGRGPFKWEDVEGVDIEWAASGLGMVRVGKDAHKQTSEVEQGDGLDDLKRFLWDA